MKKMFRIIYSVPKKLKKLRIRERLKTLARSDHDKKLSFQESEVIYEIEMIHETVNFIKGTIHKTYRILKKFVKSGILRPITIGIATVVILLSSGSEGIKAVEPVFQAPTPTPLEIVQPQSVQPSEALKSALEIRAGDLGKGSSPGSRAKADARRNAQAGKFSSGSTIIPGAGGFVPQSTYCRYHENAPLSCKPRVKVSDSSFQDNGGDNQPPPESGQFDASKYKGGPSPFEEYEYKDPAVVAQNIGFNQPNRLNKSYDKHAKDCFGIVENRNKENIEIFKGDITNLAQSADEVYKGSYRYKDPAYIFIKEINEKMTAVIVNATDGEYITSINPTSGQMEDVQLNGNIGLDTRPSMQLTLRLRGPKNSKL